MASSLLIGAAVIAEGVLPRAALAAEEVRLDVGGPILFTVSVDSLQTFAETGKIEDDLRLFTRILGEENTPRLRQVLQTSFDFDVVQVDNIVRSSLGRDFLQNIGKIFKAHPDMNAARGLRGALIKAAAQAGPEGWTILDVLHQFPTQSIDVKLSDLLTLRKTLAVYFSYNEAAVRAIQAQSAARAVWQPSVYAAKDLSQPGPYAYRQETLVLSDSALRQTKEGLQVNYDFTVKLYIPEGLEQPVPIVLISHGFGDIQESFDFLATHLASYGYAIAIPDHVGSDLGVRRNFLQGFVDTILSPLEFVSRPQEVSLVIDELERLVETSPDWAAVLDIERIGMVGDSLGGTTVLALAGAEIDYGRLDELCDDEQVIFNISMYLQCQARFLPSQTSRLGDPRLKAAIASHPLGAGLYGPESMAQIQMPILTFTGSNDIIATTIEEQIHPFIWTGSQDKYLALMTPGTHFTAKPGREGLSGFITPFVGEYRDIGTRYFKAANVAFWNAYLKEQTEFLPYLSARFAEQTSEDEPLQFDIIESLSPETLVAAYGQEPPIAIVPDSSSAVSRPDRSEPVLAEVARTGVLKVGIRQDVAPLGYVNSNGNWVGYCRTFAAELRSHIDKMVALPTAIDLVEIPSTLSSRFSLVEDESVHLECGPNIIRRDLEDVRFSRALLVAGTQFLRKRSSPSTRNPNLRIEQQRVAVLSESITEDFVRATYPQVRLVPFSERTAIREAVAALADDKIDAFVSDGILAQSELLRQNLPISDYVLLPKRPLTCEFYGLILPNDDSEWQNIINEFLVETHNERLQRELLSFQVEDQVETLDYCLNQSPSETTLSR